MEIHIARNGKQFGPFSLDEVRRQIAAGQLFLSDLGWTQGEADWKPLAAFPGLGMEAPSKDAAVSPLRALDPGRPVAGVVGGPAPTRTNSGAAVASLILGILSVSFLPVLASIPGIICGHTARSNIRQSNGALTGGGMAVAGLVMSYLGLAFWLMMLPILAGIAIPVFNEVKLRGEETRSLSNAKQIGIACHLYAVDHNEAFPQKLDELVPDYLPDRTLFTSSLSPGEPMAYQYYGGSRKDPAEKVLLMSKFKDRRGKRIMVFVDSSGRVGLPPPGY
jgi:hypothetical protein